MEIIRTAKCGIMFSARFCKCLKSRQFGKWGIVFFAKVCTGNCSRFQRVSNWENTELCGLQMSVTVRGQSLQNCVTYVYFVVAGTEEFLRLPDERN